MPSNSDSRARQVDSDTTNVCIVSSIPDDDDEDEDEDDDDDGAWMPSPSDIGREDGADACTGTRVTASFKLSMILSCSPSSVQKSHTVAMMDVFTGYRVLVVWDKGRVTLFWRNPRFATPAACPP